MQLTIPAGLPWDDGRWACAILRQAGHEAWLVGGCVRDLLLKCLTHDVDVATSAHPEQIEKLFPKVIAVGRAFGVMIAVVPEGRNIEIATFRHDGAYIDGRRPTQVVFSTAREDVRRRDFTINGLLLDPQNGMVIDHVGGVEDLQARVLRVIDGAQRIAEDRLRVLRGIRFIAHFGLTPTADTWAAVIATPLTGLSRERIWQEIIKGLAHAPARWFEQLIASGHLGEVMPPVPQIALPGIGAALEKITPSDDPLLALAIVMQAVPELSRWTWLQHEPVPRERIKRLREAITGASILLAGCALAQRRRVLRAPDAALVVRLLTCLGHVHEASAWLVAEQAIGNLAPLVSARDLLALGITPGPGLGKLLQEIEDQQLNGILKTAEEALLWAHAHK